jgi:hypothetical protein
VQLTIQGAASFILEFAGSLGSGPLGPYQPQRSGRIELTVSPTSVSYAGGAGVGGAICQVPDLSRWGPFAWTLRETNGIAVEITSFKYVVTTSAGREVSNQEIVRSISGDFTGTAAATLRVPAGASLTSRQHYDCELQTNGAPDFPGGTAVFTASGRDENGATVSSTATLVLLPPR